MEDGLWETFIRHTVHMADPSEMSPPDRGVHVTTVSELHHGGVSGPDPAMTGQGSVVDNGSEKH